MDYNFSEIERNWRGWWNENAFYKTTNDGAKPKFFVLDMFPYPSGAGLHVGHPLGYIASDIFARYKRQRGYNVLHPMGYDAFGLPAEQYAIETGQHPAVTTEQNIKRYREQLDNIGFSYDWDREVRTSDPSYYKWTQWIFTKLFHAWFDRKSQKARPIEDLIAIFEKEGNCNVTAPGDEKLSFTKEQWEQYTIAEQRACLMHYRIAYLDWAEVWWCEALGTVLANDEVVNGVSERGGHPCVRKKMRQWMLRITEYAERLLAGLEGLDWSEAMKDMQRNWIGKSSGAQITFDVKDLPHKIEIFTTRPDTIFGADFMVLAPEHELVGIITAETQRREVAEYKLYTQRRSERERISETKTVSGAFTGAYAVHPFTRKPIPIYISEYVLAGYGTGAIMAVPSGDERDHAFARHFGIHITNVFGASYKGDAAYTEKAGMIEGSDFLSGLAIPKAKEVAIRAVEDAGIGERRINYKLRDAGFSRQRYWGEPFPVIYHNDVPYTIDEAAVSLPPAPSVGGGDIGQGAQIESASASSREEYGTLRKEKAQHEFPNTPPSSGGGRGEATRALPVELPHVDTYGPGPEGQGPLANLEDWVTTPAGKRETNTMPGYAGSSWYFFRYMDPHNDGEFASREATDYWQQVDVYVGGTEHAVGHLLYARMWTKVLADLGYVSFDEPFKKLVNQGMIQGSSRFIYRWSMLYTTEKGGDAKDVFISTGLLDKIHDDQFLINELNKSPKRTDDKIIAIKRLGELAKFRVDIKLVDGLELSIDAFMQIRDGYYQKNAEFVFEDGKYICGAEVEKMSKSKYNVVNPDDIVAQYGADTFRMYEMFLGPIEVSKPWDTKGIEGVHRFLKKLWRLYVNEAGEWLAGLPPAPFGGGGDVGKEASSQSQNTLAVEGSQTTSPSTGGGRGEAVGNSAANLRTIHRLIKKVGEDIERFGFNTCVSAFMIAVNELQAAKCRDRNVLEKLAIILAPFAPHLAEELWHRFGHEGSVVMAPWPAWEAQYLTESSFTYPVAVNGKKRTDLAFPLDASESAIRKEVLANETIAKWTEGREPKKFIYVQGRMINVVV